LCLCHRWHRPYNSLKNTWKHVIVQRLWRYFIGIKKNKDP
jgi:hypothetical protein